MAFLCSRCHLRPRRPKHRYCAPCHAEYMREWRKTHRLNAEQRRRANARSYANVYLGRGLIERKPCEQCGDPTAQMHHEDYDRPLDVTWLCRGCHLDHHEGVRHVKRPAA